MTPGSYTSNKRESGVQIKRELVYLTPRTVARGGYLLALEEVELEDGWIPFAIQETRLHDGQGLNSADEEHVPGKLAVFVWLRSMER